MKRLTVEFENSKTSLLGFIALRSEGAIIGLADSMDAVGEASDAGHSDLRNFLVVLNEIDKTVGGDQGLFDGMIAGLEAEEEATVASVAAYNRLIDQYKMAAEGQAQHAAAMEFSIDKLEAYGSLESMYGRQGEEIGQSAVNSWRERNEAIAAYGDTLASGTGIESQYAEAAMLSAANTNALADSLFRTAEAARLDQEALLGTFTALSGNEEALAEYTAIMGGADGATQSLNEKIFAQISASSDSATAIAGAGVALGIYSDAEAQAMVKSALLEDFIRKQAGAFNDGKISMEEMQGAIGGYIDRLNSVPDVITTTFVAETQGSPPPWAGGNADGTVGGSGGYGGSDAGATNAAAGANFIVPPGFPNDSYRLNVQSGEHVMVTPAGQVGNGGGGGGMTFTGAITIHAAPGQNGEQLFNEFMRAAGKRSRLQRVGMG
jgi:hypothetical protein